MFFAKLCLDLYAINELTMGTWLENRHQSEAFIVIILNKSICLYEIEIILPLSTVRSCEANTYFYNTFVNRIGPILEYFINY